MKCFYFKNSSGVILHPCLPIIATSLQRPVNSVPWVACVESVDCGYDVKCMSECQQVSDTALHNFHRPQTFKKEIRKENQDQRKIFDPGGIWTQDLRIRSPSLYQLSHEDKLGAGIHPLSDERVDSQLRLMVQSAWRLMVCSKWKFLSSKERGKRQPRLA